MVRETFGAVLRKLRKRRGMNQTTLAEAAGLTGSYISVLENCKKPPPSDEKIRRLAEALDEPADALLDLAHIERIPDSVRGHMERLEALLSQERRVTNAFVNRVIPSSLFFFAAVPRPGGLSDRWRNRLRPDGVLHRFLDSLEGVRERRDFRAKVTELIQALTDEERAGLAEELPEFLAVLEPLLYERGAGDLAGDNGDAPGEVTVETDAMFPRLERGDRVHVEMDAAPMDGDVGYAALPDGSRDFRRYIPLGTQTELAAGNPAIPPLRLNHGEARRRVLGVARRIVRYL